MKIVVFEGVNAAGKSAVVRRVCDTLTSAGVWNMHLDPAAFGRIGRIVRRRLVDPSVVSSPDYDSVLFATLRAEGAFALKQSLIEKSTGFLFLERWSMALSAYGTTDGASPLLVTQLRTFLQNILAIDLTLLLDVPGVLAYRRLTPSDGPNRFEAKGPEYLDRVALNYRMLAGVEERTSCVDASVSADSTFKSVWVILCNTYPDLRGINVSPAKSL